ncbi:MAG: vanadium-dependent haloperoxidase [Myxococcales bacterium]|nr:vanadium-dependent haloperoxidase [Myxococcales bacterium]
MSVLVLWGCTEEATVKSDIYNPDHSAARNWNEALLAAIRTDLARPTVHARNLFHSSALMYDLWAVYDDTAEPYFLGRTVAGQTCEFSGDQRKALREGAVDLEAERSAAISHGMYRLLVHRFQDSPGKDRANKTFEELFRAMGHNPDFSSRDFEKGGAAKRAASLGLYLADCVIEYGLGDGANEENNYANTIYSPVNEPLEPHISGTPGLKDPNRWQPLKLLVAIDQSGNMVANQPAFVGAEWGQVVPFALPPDAFSTFERDGTDWLVCHDPGPPAYLRGPDALPEEYKWNHSVVAYWSSHLDPSDGVMWDISPGSIGNTTDLPKTIPALRDFYDELEGGVSDRGHETNPHTGEPYEPNMVPRGDYTRVLAEFWADGPQSETPPGHWFTIVNEAVNDHPELQRKYQGKGEELDPLEWDVKVYFVLGGGVHDAAVTAWGIKGWYDYVRPISAIRYMASLGQSTDEDLPRYHEEGIPLVEGYVELVKEGDALAGESGENVDKIKIYGWRGPDHVDIPAIDSAGVGWILADDWWPYQRPTFVSPPFAGYMSGHSTFSRAAAEILTAFTGDPFFPGGMGEFVAEKNEFLVFEEGPSMDVVLQWATYRDASDQTSLSRIWGGIHPPVDDIPGRRLGITIAGDALSLADAYFKGTLP